MKQVVITSAASLLALGLILSMTGSPVSAETAATQPVEKKVSRVKVTGDYGKLTLTEEQAAKIAQIQKDEKEKINAISEEADKQIEALLTADQKKQLADNEAAAKEKNRVREAEYREKNKAIKEAGKSALSTTQPSDKK